MTIWTKNLIRRVLYKMYKIYTKHLDRKFNIYDMLKVEVIKTLPKDATCVDIGTNEGQVFDFIYRHCNKGKLWAFEPIPTLAYYLYKKYPKATVWQLALSDKSGKEKFHIHCNRHAISGLKITGLANSQSIIKQINVNTSTLDRMFTGKRLDFIKIDVEGAELEVLKGAYHLLKGWHPIIVFESGKEGLHCYGHSAEDLWNYLQPLKYKISTLSYYLKGAESLTKEEFIGNFNKGYDYEFIAY